MHVGEGGGTINVNDAVRVIVVCNLFGWFGTEQFFFPYR